MKIAVIGKMRSGKDSFAKYFINKGCEEFKFGNGIGEIIQRYFPEEWAKGKPRHLYQGIGQYFRTFNENVWIDYVANQIKDKGHVIITDVRQENEVKWLKENGFKIIKVVAPEEVRIQRMIQSGDILPTDKEALDKILNHETEQYVDKASCDYVVVNDGSISDLVDKADWIYQDLFWGCIIKDRGQI